MRRPTCRLQPANDAGIRFGWAEFDPRLSGGWASGSRQRRAADLLQRRRGRDPIRRGSLLTTPSSIAIISSHPVDCTKSAFALAGITSEQTRISSPSPSRFAPVARLSRSVLEPRSVRRSGARQKIRKWWESNRGFPSARQEDQEQVGFACLFHCHVLWGSTEVWVSHLILSSVVVSSGSACGSASVDRLACFQREDPRRTTLQLCRSE